jgi:LysM repeat protein
MPATRLPTPTDGAAVRETAPSDAGTVAAGPPADGAAPAGPLLAAGTFETRVGPLIDPYADRRTADFPVYSPGQEIDASPLRDDAPTRGIRPRRRSRLQRILIGLSGGTLLLIVAGVLGLATVLSPIGARRAARQAAEVELVAELESDEEVLARVYVSQRNWSDNFRESFGVLAATDRRLLFVGVPPAPWVRREASGPPELRAQSFPYDVPFQASTRRLLLGLVPGVVVRTTAGDVAFVVPRGERQHARDIAQVVDRALAAQTEALQRDQASRVAPPPPAPVYGTHLVRPGEAVTTIARRYRTTPDVIRQLNRLPSDRIRIGQRLRVPVPADSAGGAGPRPATPAAPAPSTF